MNFFRPLCRSGLRVLAPLAVAATLLAACGGGTSQVQAFEPARLLVLGDETGMLLENPDNPRDGFKWSLNDGTTTITDPTKSARCLLLPTPAQAVAAQYALVFAACNPTNKTPAAFALGQEKALADDPVTGLRAQIDGIPNLGAALGPNDLVMFTIGTNDVIDVHEKFADRQAALAEATRRGNVVAAQVNRVLGTGARGLVLTIPVLGKSPYAIARGDSVAARITELTSAFNTALRLGIDSTRFDGRNYGLVLADDVTAAMERFKESYLIEPRNVTQAQCSAATFPRGCTTKADGSVKARSYLWASDRFLADRANEQIASQALSRVINNPF